MDDSSGLPVTGSGFTALRNSSVLKKIGGIIAIRSVHRGRSISLSSFTILALGSEFSEAVFCHVDAFNISISTHTRSVLTCLR